MPRSKPQAGEPSVRRLFSFRLAEGRIQRGEFVAMLRLMGEIPPTGGGDD